MKRNIFSITIYVFIFSMIFIQAQAANIETPTSTKIVLFHPTYYLGENQFGNVENYLLEDGQKYSKISYFIQNDIPQDKADWKPKITIETFKQQLGATVGILLIGGHGDTDKILVETYFNKEYAKTRYEELINLKKYGNDEIGYSELDFPTIVVNPGSDNERTMSSVGTIFVTNKFVSNHINLKGGTIVYLGICEGGPLEAFVSKNEDKGGARVAIGPTKTISARAALGLTNRFFAHLNGENGRNKRTVEAAVADIKYKEGEVISELRYKGNGKTVLNPTVTAEKSGGEDVDNAQTITFRFDSTVIGDITKILKSEGAELKDIKWRDDYTLETTLQNVQPEKVVKITVIGTEISSKRNSESHLDGNTDPKDINGRGPAHDDYVRTFSGNFADHGDAPSPYLDARHFYLDYEWFGNNIDTESEPKKDDKDDGVDIKTKNNKLDVKISVKISGDLDRYINKKIFVNGWFDFDHNEDWQGSNEHVIKWSGGPGIGDWKKGEYEYDIKLSVDIPAGSKYEDSWARFRLSYDQNIDSPTEDAKFGEVEDWPFLMHVGVEKEPIGPRCSSTDIFFGCHYTYTNMTIKGSSSDSTGLIIMIIFLIIISIYKIIFNR